MKKLSNFLIVCLFICLLSIFNVASAAPKEELPEPVIGLSEDEVYDQNTYISENLQENILDNNIEPQARRSISSSGNAQRPANVTPVPFEGQQNEDDLFAVLPKKDVLEQEQYDDSGLSDDEFVPGEIIVCFKDECSSSMISKLISDQKVVKAKDIYKSVYDSVMKSRASVNAIGFKTLKEDIGKYYVVNIESKSKEDVLKTIEKLNKEPTVKYAEPNYICKPCEVPNDYNNYDLWNMDRIQMPEAWDIFHGSNIRVGVLDTGIDASHPDIKDNIDINLGWNCARKENVDTMDYYFHGTHVAGTIGARGNNSIGVVGVNPYASLIPIKICFANDNQYSSATLMAEGIAYATTNNIPVCNLSYSISESNTLIDAIKKYGESGGILVIAAGNGGKCIDDDHAYTSVAALDNVILVANSTNYSGEKENLNAGSNYGKIVHVAAPGTNIISTVPKGGYAVLSGTSMAAPHVTGVVSLLKEKYSDMTSKQIRQTIMDGVDFVYNLEGKVASNGRLNAKNAINRTTDESYLKVIPNTGETMAAAIKRSLGSRSASEIKVIKLIGVYGLVDGSLRDSASAVLPNLQYADVSEYLGHLKKYAFAGCSNLTMVTLPEENVKLPAYCFMNCTKLSTIYKANSSSRIMNEADFTGLISGSEGQFAIQTQCFEGCTNLKTIKLPNTSKLRISQFAFNGCSNLSTIYIDTQIPVTGEANLTGLTELGWCIFRGTGIVSVELPKDVNISQEAFANCSKLKSIQVYPA